MVQPVTRIRLLNGLQAVFWLAFGAYYAAIAPADYPFSPYWLAVCTAGAFILRGLASAALALLTPATNASYVAVVVYILSTWPVGIVLVAFVVVVRPLDLDAILLAILGVVFLLQAVRSHATMVDVVRFLRGQPLGPPIAITVTPEPSAPQGPATLTLLWGAPLSGVTVEDEAKFREAVREGRILLLASEGGAGARFVGVATGTLRASRYSEELPREAVIRDPGTSQVFRAAGLKPPVARAILIHRPEALREVPQ